MKNEDRVKMCQRFVEAWGMVNQTLLAIEEMAELTKELLKLINRGETNTEKIKEEIADVRNMMMQLECMFGNTDDILDEKINRTALKLPKRKPK